MIENLVRYPLGKICRVINGRAYKQSELLNDGAYRVLRVGNFFSNNSWYYSDLELDEDKYCDFGDLLYAWSASFGPRIWTEEKVIYHYHIWKMVPNEEIIDKIYLFYLLKNKTLSFMNSTHGSIMLHLTKGFMEELKLDIPSNVVEQKKIAKVLSDLDAKIEINNKINAELEAMAKLIYDYWFVQFDFPNEEGKPYKSSGGAMVYNEELKREIPVGWSVNSLEDLVELVKGNVSPNDISPDTPYVGLEHIPRKTIVLGDWESVEKVDSNKCEFQKGDILFGKIRPYFHKVSIAFVDGITSTDTIVMRPKKKEYSGIALQTVFTDRFVEIATVSSTGTKMPRANWKVLKNYPVALDDEGQLLNKYQLIMDRTISKIELNVFENRQLSELRDWLLPMLMNGQVKVSNYNTKEIGQSLSLAAETNPEYKKPGKANSKQIDNYKKIQILYSAIWANQQINVKQGEMATAKDVYLLDRIYGVNTGFNFARNNWGAFDPKEKQLLNTKQYFHKPKFPNSKAFYLALRDNGKLLDKIPEELKVNVYRGIQSMNEKVFKSYFGTKKANMKELYATILKCIEDEQTIEFPEIRSAMKKWSIKQKNSKWKTKAEKFSVEETKEALKIIVEEKWFMNVIH